MDLTNDRSGRAYRLGLPDRGASSDLAWDVGYYTLAVEHADGSSSDPSRGKFTTVWRRDAGRGWRIHVDAFSPASPPDD